MGDQWRPMGLVFDVSAHSELAWFSQPLNCVEEWTKVTTKIYEKNVFTGEINFVMAQSRLCVLRIAIDNKIMDYNLIISFSILFFCAPQMLLLLDSVRFRFLPVRFTIRSYWSLVWLFSTFSCICRYFHNSRSKFILYFRSAKKLHTGQGAHWFFSELSVEINAQIRLLAEPITPIFQILFVCN